MAAVDHLLHFRQAADGQIPPNCIARYLCTKASWRGKYRRVLCITSNCITTQHPDSLTITNRWDFTADTDIDGVSAPSSNAEEQEFTLSVRQDVKVPAPMFFQVIYSILSQHCLHLTAEQVQGCQVHMQTAKLSPDHALSGHCLCSYAWPVPYCLQDSWVGQRSYVKRGQGQGRW